MPVDLFERDGVIHGVVKRTLTSQDLKNGAGKVEELESRGEMTPNRLFDWREADSVTLTFADIERVARDRGSQTHKTNSRTAIIVNSPVKLGLANMWKTMVENDWLEIEVFRDEAEALRWLAEKPAPRASTSAE